LETKRILIDDDDRSDNDFRRQDCLSERSDITIRMMMIIRLMIDDKNKN